MLFLTFSSFFFFNDTATTEIYTLSLHDALPISATCAVNATRRGGDERTSPRRRATTERRPSAPTTTRLRYVSRFPLPDRAKTPAAVLPSKTTLSTVRPSRTMAPSRAAAATRIVSNVVRGRAKLYGRGPPRNRPHMAAPQGATTFIPYSLACAAPSTASRMPPPSRSRISVVAGLKYSEHALSRGKRARSTSRTDAPARASSNAVVAPAGPAPTTTTSQRSVTTLLRARPRPPPSVPGGGIPPGVPRVPFPPDVMRGGGRGE